MGKQKSMIKECTQKWLYVGGLFFCSFRMFSSIAEAESEELEFNCKGRLIFLETNLHEHSQYDPILHKRSYNQKNYDLRYYDKNGKSIGRESHIYKDNMLVKTLGV